MVDRMVGDQFEMSEGPVVGYGSNKVADSRVFDPEFARIVGVDRHSVA
jgi:hypothetical protein